MRLVFALRSRDIDGKYLVADTPDGDTKALGDARAGRDDGLEVGLLLGELGSGDGQGDSDVELGDHDIETSVGQTLQLGLDTSDLSKNEMGLRADTVNRDSTALQAADEGNQSIDLGAGSVKVVVVDAKLCGRVGGSGSLERNVDELLTEKLVKDCFRPSAYES